MISLLGLARGALGGVWVYLAAGAAVLAIVAGVYRAGVSAERKRGEAASLRRELATARVDANLNRVTADAAERDRAAIERQLTERNEVIDDYERELAKRGPVAACRVGSDARRLRGLAGP